MKDSFPNFLIIGAQKAGTTWLYRNLGNHPEIWMPREKELHYFDEKIKRDSGFVSRLTGKHPMDLRWRRQIKNRLKRWSKDPRRREHLAWDLRYFLGKPGDEWYAGLFREGRGKVTGETTPDYSVLRSKDIEHIYRIMPETKIVFMMRNPIERPWSVAEMGIRISGRSRENIPDDEFHRQFETRRVRLMTNYERTLRHWSKHFPPERIFVGFLEDVHFFPDELLGALHEFLGVDSSAEYRMIRHKVHSGTQSTMPTRFAVHLAEAHREDIARLREDFGGYAAFWDFCAERLLEAPPTDDGIPYPLYESPLWDEWGGAQKAAFGSGPLSIVRAASS